MKNSSGYNCFFRELGRIPRPEKQKRESFQKIMDELDGRTRGKKNFLPRFLTAAAVLAACVLFTLIIFSEEDLNRGTQPDLIGNRIITQSVISLSESKKTFSAEGSLTDKTAIVQDEEWEKAARLAINSAQPADVLPSSKPQYDVQILLKGEEPLKFKIWEEDGAVFFRTMDNEEAFKVSPEESTLFLEYLKYISKSIQKTP